MNEKLMTRVVAAAGIVGLCFATVDAQRRRAEPTHAAVDTQSKASPGTPRLPNGQPDLNGMWYHRIGAPVPLIKPGESYDAKVAPTGQLTQYPVGFPKYKPELLAKVADLKKRTIQMDPTWRCGAPGVPRIGPPQKIVQTAKEIVFLYDDLSGNFFRVVRMNVPHRTDIEVTAHGDSVGRWEGDTLVVDVTSLDDTTWLTDDGAFHTLQTRVVERLRRDGNNLHYEATVHDPEVLVEPWKVNGRVLPLMTNYEIEEAPHCRERDATELPIDGFHGNIR
jgi:hypothetical protein